MFLALANCKASMDALDGQPGKQYGILTIWCLCPSNQFTDALRNQLEPSFLLVQNMANAARYMCLLVDFS